MAEGPGQVTGKVYLVGAGPGDPGLLTVKGLACLQSSDCVLHDSLVSPRLLEQVPEGCEVVSVGHRSGETRRSSSEISAMIIERARAGKNVVRLKGGDPFVFGRGGEEGEALRAAGVSFQVVPGVTSGVAAPAYAGIPLTYRGIASSVTFVTGHPRMDGTPGDGVDYGAIAGGADTLVFFMGGGNLARIAEQLIRHGRPPETPVAVIRWGTTPSQRTVTGTLGDLPIPDGETGLRAPTLIVVGEVVARREGLSWFEARPLFGRRIVVTRSREQSGDLTRRLEDAGAEVIEVPTIRIEDPVDWGPVDEAISAIGSFHWVVFTSSNGVERFLRRLFGAGKDVRALASAQLAAIGPATASRLEDFGLRADLRPERNVGESLVEALTCPALRGKRVLIPAAAGAREVLPRGLRESGASVTEVKVYRTVRPGPLSDDLVGRIRRGEIDLFTFTSSSTVTHFAEMLGEGTEPGLAAAVRCATIGPVTARTARDRGISVAVETDPGDITVPGLVKAIQGYFEGSG